MTDDAATWLTYLGKSPQEPHFDEWLESRRIYERPHRPEDDEAYSEDEGKALRNARSSEIEEGERLSIALIYEKAGNYERLFGDIDGTGEFVLKQLVFYAKGVQGYAGFATPLPFGIGFGQDAQTTRSKLGPPTATRALHGLISDLWVREDFNVNVSYLDAGERCAIVHVRRAHLYDLRMLGKLPYEHDAAAIDPDALALFLGESIYGLALTVMLDSAGWSSDGSSLADCEEIPDLIKRRGLTLYLRNAGQYKALRGQKFERDGAVLAGFRFNRTGDMNSQGHLGRLPLGIEFHHAPDQVIDCVGRPPDAQTIGEDVGSYQWRLAPYTLQVTFSLIDYQVYRVTCFARFMDDEIWS